MGAWSRSFTADAEIKWMCMYALNNRDHLEALQLNIPPLSVVATHLCLLMNCCETAGFKCQSFQLLLDQIVEMSDLLWRKQLGVPVNASSVIAVTCTHKSYPLSFLPCTSFPHRCVITQESWKKKLKWHIKRNFSHHKANPLKKLIRKCLWKNSKHRATLPRLQTESHQAQELWKCMWVWAEPYCHYDVSVVLLSISLLACVTSNYGIIL